jgi:hypothetical protein
MPTADRKNLGVAKGVSIHIGGIYSNPKTKSGYAITGSKGCFTINGGDSANTAAEADVENRQDANKTFMKGEFTNGHESVKL